MGRGLLLAGLLLAASAWAGPAEMEGNRARWEEMPPQAREKIMENYKRWRSLSVEKRELIRDRAAFFLRLSAERRAAVAEALARKARGLPPFPALEGQAPGREGNRAIVRPAAARGERSARPRRPERPSRAVRPERPRRPARPPRPR